jgi:hypothetical protein
MKFLNSNGKLQNLSDVLAPRKRSLSFAIHPTDDSAVHQLALTLFESLRLYLDTAADFPLFTIFKLVDANSESLSFEFALQALTESNSVVPTDSVLRAWNLLILAVDRYPFCPEHKKILLSYFLGASLPAVDRAIREKALMCIVRISLTRPDPCDAPDSPDEAASYLAGCVSTKPLFGVSVAEVLCKEELAGVAHVRCVPAILRLFVQRLLEAGAREREGVFRVSGSQEEVDRLITVIDGGDWGFPATRLATTASLTKRWFRELQEPIVPLSLLEGITDAEPSDSCIRAALDLPAPQRDSLMFFIGFLQDLLRFVDVTKMTILNFVTVLAPMFARIPPAASLSDVDMKPYNRLTPFVKCLMDNWDTTELYP